MKQSQSLRFATQTQTLAPLQGHFTGYDLSDAYDEMFDSTGTPRHPYHALYERLLELPTEELEKRQAAADLSFYHQGITFTVYGNDEGTERIFPYDLLPRRWSAA
jgi:uncharacterized circularly permuted ATP-grasp superfamily protein